MKNKRVITVIILSIVFLMLLSIFIKSDLPKNIFKLKGNVTEEINGAVFDKGDIVNVKMKTLAGNISATHSTIDINITNIKRSNTLNITPTEDNIVSKSDSEIPIYMWFDNGTIYWYTEDQIPKLNEDSRSFFYTLDSLVKIEDLDEFDTSYVQNMGTMFYGCKSLENLDLSSFVTNSVTNFGQMFQDCTNLIDLNISDFNTSNAIEMDSMFYNCKSLKNLNLNNFNTENVDNMYNMFYGCNSLTSLDLSSFNTSNVTDMRGMFQGCSSLTNIIFGNNFNTSNVLFMKSMFFECESLESLDLSSFDTRKVSDMSYMFYKCSSLTNLNLNNFDTSKVTDMSYMFSDCKKLKNLYLDSFNTSSVINMAEMFGHCESLISLNINNFNTNNVTNMASMFNGCINLKKLYINSFITNKVEDMFSMFTDCKNLEELDLSNFDTSSVTRVDYMFCGCSKLKTIYVNKNGSFTLNGFDPTEDSAMFADCYKLVGGNGTKYASVHIDDNKTDGTFFARIDESDNPGYFTKKELIIIDNNVVFNINNTKETISNLFDDDISIFSNNVEIGNKTKLKTGDILKTDELEYEIVILGDTTKDGKIDIMDIQQVYNHYKYLKNPSKGIEIKNTTQREAANYNQDNIIDIMDIQYMYNIYKEELSN